MERERESEVHKSTSKEERVEVVVLSSNTTLRMRSNKGFLDPFQGKHIRKTVTITIIYRNRESERR